LSTEIKDVSNGIKNTSLGMLEFQHDVKLFIDRLNKTTSKTTPMPTTMTTTFDTTSETNFTTPIDVETTTTKFTCPDEWTNETMFFPDPYDCTQYYQCTEEGFEHLSCPYYDVSGIKLLWDNINNTCNWPWLVDCDAYVTNFWTKQQGVPIRYLLSHQRMNFFLAEEFCREKGGMVAEPRSDVELLDIINLINGTNGYNYWIGLTDYYHEENFRWNSDGRSPTFTNWSENEPNDHQGIEECAYLNTKGKWRDLSCLVDTIFNKNATYIMSVICQL